MKVTSKMSRACFLKDKAERASLDKRCPRQVARWIWATGPLHDLAPDVRLCAKGEELAGRPRYPVNVHQYGFDKQDRLVLMRTYSGYGGYTTTYFTYQGETIVAAQFGAHNKQCERHYRLSEGRVVAMEVHWGSPVVQTWTDLYEYEGDRLVSAQVNTYGYQRPNTVRCYQYQYDSKGKLSRVTTGGKGKKRTLVDKRGARLVFSAPHIVDRFSFRSLPPLRRKQFQIALRAAWGKGSFDENLRQCEEYQMIWEFYRVTRAGKPVYDAWILNNDSGTLFAADTSKESGIEMIQSSLMNQSGKLDKEIVEEVSEAYAKGRRPFDAAKFDAYWRKHDRRMRGTKAGASATPRRPGQKEYRMALEHYLPGKRSKA
jgi:hypothetical protein